MNASPPAPMRWRAERLTRRGAGLAAGGDEGRALEGAAVGGGPAVAESAEAVAARGLGDGKRGVDGGAVGLETEIGDGGIAHGVDETRIGDGVAGAEGRGNVAAEVEVAGGGDAVVGAGELIDGFGALAGGEVGDTCARMSPMMRTAREESVKIWEYSRVTETLLR